ncbi:MAG: Gfo/Idh/MocA family oxidoreductase [Anaerolineaceae bacterium]|nr:MAG: Gfo/Idh/MocA family oxidoreductase [Anaerolineaceae bacterium]
MLRIALIGFSQGYYAIEYTRYLSRLKDIEIIGICDMGKDEKYVMDCAFISAQDFALEMKAPLYHSYDDLLKYKPDAVLICCETKDHGVLAEIALKKGIHVFVSKPLGFNYEQIKNLDAVRQKHIRLLCGNPLKYEQGIVEFHERLQNKEIGSVYSIRVMINHLAMTKQEWERNTKLSGGPFGTYGIYLFDLARWLSGKSISKLFAIGDNYVTPEIDAYDTIKIIGIHTDNTQCLLELYSGIKHDYPFVQVEAIGDKGTLITKYDNYTLISQSIENVRLGSLRSTDMTIGEMEHFLDCIKNNAEERCNFEDMTYVVRCLEAGNESMIKHKFVDVKWEGLKC